MISEQNNDCLNLRNQPIFVTLVNTNFLRLLAISINTYRIKRAIFFYATSYSDKNRDFEPDPSRW
jgi:hypothetical protein